MLSLQLWRDFLFLFYLLMQLLTKELLQKFASLGSLENNPDPIVIAKYYYGSWTWFATEFDSVTQIFFGRKCI